MSANVFASILLAVSILICCKSEREFPMVKKLSEFKNTEFIATLEENITEDKNSIYCATLLFA